MYRVRQLLNPALLSRVLHEEGVWIPERSKELKEICLGVGLRPLEDAIFERPFADLLLCTLAHQRLEIYIWFGKDACIALIDIRLLVIEGSNENLSRGDTQS